MFPWQHILERALMRNGAIQLSYNVTVTLLLNQSLQNFEVFSEMISSTSVQNFSRKKCFILPWQHILLRVLKQNRVLEIIDDVIVTSFCSQSQQNFVFLFVIPNDQNYQKSPGRIGLKFAYSLLWPLLFQLKTASPDSHNYSLTNSYQNCQ